MKKSLQVLYNALVILLALLAVGMMLFAFVSLTVFDRLGWSMSPKDGFLRFLRTTPGYLLCIQLPFLTLILMLGAGSVRTFRQYKQEQLAELTAQREQLEEERIESRRILEELQRNGTVTAAASFLDFYTDLDPELMAIIEEFSGPSPYSI